MSVGRTNQFVTTNTFSNFVDELGWYLITEIIPEIKFYSQRVKFNIPKYPAPINFIVILKTESRSILLVNPPFNVSLLITKTV